MTSLQPTSGDVEGLVAGFRVAGSPDSRGEGPVVWFDDEGPLFRTDVKASVIEDLRLLSDVALNLFSARPTLFVIDDEADAMHLSLLLVSRKIILSPHDGIVLAPGIAPRGGFREHLFASVGEWLTTDPEAVLPPTLSRFASFSKADFSRAGSQGAPFALPTVQHFWRIIGEHGAMAQTVMAAAGMIRVGNGGPFDKVTPTLLFVDPAEVGRLEALSMPQSVSVVAPFALSNQIPVDELLSDFVDARREPFHVHDVAILGEQEEATLGCLYGEYVV